KDLYPNLQDDEFPVRQVDFLIKALLYRLQVPTPLPRGLSEEKSGAIALYCLTEYGRWGWFPTFEDTTEYRICLNGVKGRFPPKAENALLPMISAVEESDNSANREKLLEAMRGRNLYFAFSVPEESLRNGPITADTPIQFLQHDWHGTPCVFGY